MNDMKNIVVLKNLPSNLIEEAIVILKPNQKIKKMEYIEKNIEQQQKAKKKESLKNPKEYIIKEAELVIHNYMNTIEEQKKKKVNTRNIETKYKRLKAVSFILLWIMLVSFFIK